MVVAHHVGMSTTTSKSPVDAFVGPLADAVLAVLETRPEFHAIVQALVAADRQSHPSPAEKRLYSLADIQRKYGVGRTVSMGDIKAGRLRATERRCRGGKIGKFVTVEEAERVYARLPGRA